MEHRLGRALFRRVLVKVINVEWEGGVGTSRVRGIWTPLTRRERSSEAMREMYGGICGGMHNGSLLFPPGRTGIEG